MSRVLAKKAGLFVLSLAVFFFVSGCETVTAMKKGDVTMNDLVEITKLRAKPCLLASSAQVKDTKECKIFDFSKIDAWFQNKFW